MSTEPEFCDFFESFNNYYLISSTDPDQTKINLEEKFPDLAIVSREKFLENNASLVKETFLPIIGVLVIIALAIGIAVNSRMALAYTVAAALAGAAGALLAQTTGFASLDVFEFHRSADVMLILVVGGVGWLYGGVTGAIVFKLMQDAISSITPQYWTFWIGLFLVVLVLVGRERLIRPWTWFGKGKTGAAP